MHHSNRSSSPSTVAPSADEGTVNAIGQAERPSRARTAGSTESSYPPGWSRIAGAAAPRRESRPSSPRFGGRRPRMIPTGSITGANNRKAECSLRVPAYASAARCRIPPANPRARGPALPGRRIAPGGGFIGVPRPGPPGGVVRQTLGTLQVAARMVPASVGLTGVAEAEVAARSAAALRPGRAVIRRSGLVHGRAEIRPSGARRLLIVTTHHPRN